MSNTTFSTKDIQIGDFITFKAFGRRQTICVHAVSSDMYFGTDVDQDEVACFHSEVVENLGQ